MTVTCAALMCHAPIVIPQIAGDRAEECARTTAAMRELAARLCAHEPDVLVLISPHTPRDPTRFGVSRAAWLEGDFGRFGVSEVGVRMRGAPEAAAAVIEAATERDLSTWSPSGSQLDHGALVPMTFLVEAGYTGKVLLIALPYPDTGLEPAMGHAIADAARTLGQRFVVLASGDMSHRLIPGAPAGFHPRAKRFDQRFVELLTHGELGEATRLQGELRELAAEDVVDSCAVAAAAVGFDATGHRVLSYEGPFGVGYCEALLYEGRPPVKKDAKVASSPGADSRPPRELLAVARDAIDARLRGARFVAPRLAAPWHRSRGVFVTLRDADGGLRGCIGHLEPKHDTLAEEVAACAIATALHDSRFARVELGELEDLRIEISLLSPAEPVRGLSELDPLRYGVIVSRGERRGVLLPEIEGVSTAAEQVSIASRKAGLAPDEDVSMERFEVVKLRESRPPHEVS
jgi:AmmeMemoRadiSam system protein A